MTTLRNTEPGKTRLRAFSLRISALVAGGAVLAVGLGLIAPAVASAAVTAPSAARAGAPLAAPAPASAEIRAAHFSPQTPGVDVYLSTYSGTMTKLWQSDITYGAVSPYVPVDPGLYIVSMRPAGAAASTPAMLSWTLQATAGTVYTAAAVATKSAGTANDVKGVVFTDDLTPPAAGQARVRLIQAASNATTADLVAVDGPSLAANAAFGTSTGYAQVPAGTWPLEARSVGTDPVTTTGSVSVPAGSVTSVVLLNGPGNTLKLQSVLDASAPVVAPTGPVDAGGGGTAGNPAPSQPGDSWPAPAVSLVLATLLVALLAGAVLTIRQRRSATLTIS